MSLHKISLLFALTIFCFAPFNGHGQTKGIPLPPGVGVAVVAGSESPLTTTGYERASKPLTAQEIAELNKPATVQVYAYYKVQARYPEPNSISLVLLKYEATQHAEDGLIQNTPFAKLNYILARLSQRPEDYISATKNMMAMNIVLNSRGSGFFLTPDGYIATNAHVVEVNMVQQRFKAAQFILNDIVKGELKSLVEEYGNRADPEIYDACLNDVIMYYSKKVMLHDEKVSYGIKTGKTLEDQTYQLEAKVITKGSEIPGKDVAILKVEGNHWPVAAVGNDVKLKTGDKLFVMGYPGVVEANDILKEQQMREPSFTEGMMNARQETELGWTAIQLDAASYRGNSGGPVFNIFGEVVGLLTFGSENEDKSALIQGFNFIVPMHVVAEFVRMASVQPQFGEATHLFREAIDAKNTQDDEAIELYNKLKILQPNWPYLNSHISEASTIPPSKVENAKEVAKGLGLRWWHYTALAFLVISGISLIVRKLSN